MTRRRVSRGCLTTLASKAARMKRFDIGGVKRRKIWADAAADGVHGSEGTAKSSADRHASCFGVPKSTSDSRNGRPVGGNCFRFNGNAPSYRAKKGLFFN